MTYDTWAAELAATLKRLRRSRLKSAPPLLDSKSAYNLGWSPERTARALLGYEPTDLHDLITLVRERGDLPPKG